jgi:tetratricopeptide (TPR) repeat protein
VAAAVIVASLLAAWSQWEPQGSVDASQEALALLASDPARALSAAQTGVARDPLSVQALFTLANVQQSRNELVLARATLQRAVRLQPSNPQTWLHLGEYDLSNNPRIALGELQAAIFLNPEWISPEAITDDNAEAIEVQNAYVDAFRASGSP